MLRQEEGWRVGGAMHYFQGDLATAQECVDLGFCVSLAKPLLRRPDLQAIATALPLESIVIETDSYPQPFKGAREKWTEPRDVRLVAERLAELVRERRRSTVDVVAVEGVNHLLIPADTGSVAEYDTLSDKRMAAGVTEALVDWIGNALP